MKIIENNTLVIDGDAKIEMCIFRGKNSIQMISGHLDIIECIFDCSPLIPSKWYDLMGWIRFMRQCYCDEKTSSKNIHWTGDVVGKDQQIASLKAELEEYKRLVNE